MRNTRTYRRITAVLGLLALPPTLTACGDSDKAGTTVTVTGKDPATAAKATVDRFSATAGDLMVRDATNGLPAANVAVDFDKAPFITMGLGPQGQKVRYYNFDVQPTAPAPIYVLFRAGEMTPVAGQFNIIDVLPGEAGYSDFWQVNKVTVPATYVANTYTSLAELKAAALTIAPTTMLVNCPVVPDGSTATQRLNGGAATLVTGWHKNTVVKYFSFEEKALSGATVPVSPIYVLFNVNPDQPMGGPGSGFKTEAGSAQTHNVVGTLPTDPTYSPLWSVNVLNNSAFDGVKDLATAQANVALAVGVANVNCPIVMVSGATASAEAPVPTEAAALKAYLMAGTYTTLKAEPAIHDSTGPHGRVRTYFNAALAASVASGSTNHPVGAASVKELFGTADAMIGWAVLVKTDAVSDKGKGFYWYEIINGSVVVNGKGVGLCTGCHDKGKDLVLTPTF